MSHCQIILDGRSIYNGPIGPNTIPTTPDLIPEALRAFRDKNAPPTPLAKMIGLAAIINMLCDLMTRQFGVNTELTTYGENRHTITITPST